jgi:hypothetical protein
MWSSTWGVWVTQSTHVLLSWHSLCFKWQKRPNYDLWGSIKILTGIWGDLWCHKKKHFTYVHNRSCSLYASCTLDPWRIIVDTLYYKLGRHFVFLTPWRDVTWHSDRDTGKLARYNTSFKKGAGTFGDPRPPSLWSRLSEWYQEDPGNSLGCAGHINWYRHMSYSSSRYISSPHFWHKLTARLRSTNNLPKSHS